MSNKLLRVFLDADMRGGHNALSKQMIKEGIDPLNLKHGQHVVFINRKCSKMKVYSSTGVLSYLAPFGNSRLDLGALNFFTESFGAAGFSYDKALRRVLEEKLRPMRVAPGSPSRRDERVVL